MLTLRLKIHSPIPIDLGGITPDRLRVMTHAQIAATPILFGRVFVPLTELFEVTGEDIDETLEIQGDLSKVRQVGAGMTAGTLIATNPGPHAGARMTGGVLQLESAGDWLGAEMSGGTIKVERDAANLVGAGYRGARRGMSGGTIIIHGNAGDEVGLRMRRGAIVVHGSTGHHTGAAMIAGTIIARAGIGHATGRGMKRGTIISAPPSDPEQLGFVKVCEYSPPIVSLIEREFSIALNPPGEVVSCYRGDLVTGGRGEWFHLPPLARGKA